MEALMFLGMFVFIGALGFWLTGKLDRFMAGGGFPPYWDEEEACRAAGTPAPGGDLASGDQMVKTKTTPRL